MDANELKAERVRRGIKQYRLAAALGIPQTTLANIENGHKPVSGPRLAEIADAIERLSRPETVVTTALIGGAR